MRPKLVVAGAFGAAGVILAAAGAHALGPEMPDRLASAFHTGVNIHLVHAPVLLALALAGERTPFRLAFWLLCAGVVFFSGSLYGLGLFAWRPLGVVTPFGGLLLIAGWTAIAYAGFRESSSQAAAD